MAHRLPLGKWKGKCENNFCRSSKVNRIIAYFTFVFVCLLCSSVLLLHLILYHSVFYLSVCVSGLCVCFHKWMREAGWHRAQRHIRGGSSPAPPPLFLSLIQAPSSLLQRWACTLAVAPAAAAEARLLFKAALSFGLFPFLFFSADVNRVASQSFVPLSHTPHLPNHKKGKERTTRRRSTKQDGDSCGWCSSSLPPSYSSSLLGVRKNTFSKFPPVLPTTIRFRLVVEMDLCFNVHQLNVVI